MIEIINKHIDAGKAVHIKKGIQPFGWDVVVKHLRECADEIYSGTPNGILSYQLNQAEEIEDVKKVIEYLNKDMTLKIVDSRIFTSFTTRKDAVPTADKRNMLLWAITGNMTINLLDDDSEESYYKEELTPGDIVYIPADMPHRIDAHGERALVSFGIEFQEDVGYNLETTKQFKKDGNNESEKD